MDRARLQAEITSLSTRLTVKQTAPSMNAQMYVWPGGGPSQVLLR